MRKPCPDADNDILDGIIDAREERIDRRARKTKKAKKDVGKLIRF